MVIVSVVLPIRAVASLFILVTAVADYYSDHLGIVIDSDMIRTAMATSAAEAGDLLNIGFLTRLLVFGVVPAALIWFVPFQKASLIKEIRYRSQAAVGVVALLVFCVWSSSEHYASFFREHKPLRYYMHPTASIYAMGDYIRHEIKQSEVHDYVALKTTANVVETDTHRELVILVVGETARADHFSLNGYPRLTNPKLSKEERLISYSDITSCGTLTAVSVPCMFAYSDREHFDQGAADYTENALDMLNRAGVNILWRDNNSDSKGVAARVTYQDFKTADVNPECDVECRDTGMLDGLQEYIDGQQGDMLIVLHSMGSHGPAYFKRYPEEFEQFKPACHTLELSQCSNEEIINAYDNTILYTDYFISKVIELLKNNTPRFETAMFYVSDHGESLGESGIYLHGMPYMLAPDAQIKVPVIAWAGETSDIDYEKSLALKDVPNSHDALFSALLAAYEMEHELDGSDKQPLVYIKED